MALNHQILMLLARAKSSRAARTLWSERLSNPSTKGSAIDKSRLRIIILTGPMAAGATESRRNPSAIKASAPIALPPISPQSVNGTLKREAQSCHSDY